MERKTENVVGFRQKLSNGLVERNPKADTAYIFRRGPPMGGLAIFRKS